MSADDTVQILSLLARLAHLADEGSVDGYLQLFTPDAIWELTSETAAGAAADTRVGHSEIGEGVRARRAGGGQGPGTGTRHVITTAAIEEFGDEARSVAYWQFYSGTTGSPQLTAMGRYDDVLRRTESGWKLAHRVIQAG